MRLDNINILVFAFLGDSVYDLYVRKYLIDNGFNNVNSLQKESLKYVSAVSQAKIVDELINNNVLSEDEIGIYKRGRNYKSNSHPKNCDIVTYKKATGLECVIGYLYLIKDYERIDDLFKIILG